MNELEINNTVKPDENQSVTFKISGSEKENLVRQANEFGVSLSEYIRIKLLLNEEEGQQLYAENQKLKKQLLEYKVKNRSYTAAEATPGTIVLKTTEEGIKLLRDILNNSPWHLEDDDRRSITDEEDIAYAITHIFADHLMDKLWNFPNELCRINIHNVNELREWLFSP